MNRRRNNKKKCQRIHAKKRISERYGVEVNRKDLVAMVGMIHRNEGEFLEKQSNRVSMWRICFKEKELTVLYDKIRKEIVTALPIRGR